MAVLDLNYFAHGDVPGNVKKDISEIVGDCYKKFGDRVPYKIEVHVFDTEEIMASFLKQERFKLGIPFNNIDDSSPCTYDALRGFPRLLIPIDRLAGYSKLARAGAIRHEAAHTILHGGLEYNIFQIPEDCRHTAMIKGIDTEKLEGVFFELTLGIKDLEATRFLTEHGFIHCQFAYALDWIKPTEEDKTAWMVSKTSRQTRFIYESALIRPLLFANPLLSLPKSSKVPLEDQLQLGARIEKMIAMLGETEENKVLQVAAAIIEVLSEDTHNNIDAAFHQLMSLI
jgi:hypothetical protein